MKKLIKLIWTLLQSMNNNAIEGYVNSLILKLNPKTALLRALQGKKKLEIVEKLENVRTKVNQTITGLQRQIVRNPAKVMDLMDKKFTIQDKRLFSNMLSSNNEGTQVFLSSSGIQWAIGVPINGSKNKGILTLKLRTKSIPNPSGVYTFPLHGHPHGYGNYVDRMVYDVLRFSSSAGTDFGKVFYRSWYNTHRGCNYLQAPKNNK